ncbi:hypothetical protein E1301_Tti020368 [Triplophysa tibetana]|uniref:Uncharacterized protein n=1 Tax=Triplophysa tibetana TaxID=1572043 RepID=A0A5A9N3V0_9TELE|nr:hypothetical protein E1301_Tti020368 [Triplophysa tibetana]
MESTANVVEAAARKERESEENIQVIQSHEGCDRVEWACPFSFRDAIGSRPQPHNGERAPMNITWSAVGSAPYGKQEVSDVTAVSRLQSADLASRWQASVGQLEQA